MAPATLGALSHAILGDNKTHWLAWYLNAVTGKKVRDRMFKLQERVKQKPQDAELFNSIFDPEKRGDKVHTQRTEVAYDEPTAKEITRAAAPVVTASNIDSNPSRNVLFVPVHSLVLPPTTNLPFASMRPSSLMHRSCLPPMLSKVQNQSRPFCTAPFYVEPAANVLAGHVPQKPYEHNGTAGWFQEAYTEAQKFCTQLYCLKIRPITMEVLQ